MATSPAPTADRSLSPEGLRDLLSIVNSSRGLQEILTYIVAQARVVLGADGAIVYLRDEQQPMLLRANATEGIPEHLLNPTAIVGQPVIGLAVSNQRTVASIDIPAILQRPAAATIEEQLEDRGAYLDVVRRGPASAVDPALQERNRRIAAEYHSLVALPLVARDETYGTLVLYFKQDPSLDEPQVYLGLAFAQQGALAIENAKLRAQAEQRLDEIVRRQRVAEGLRDLLAVVNSNHDLDEIFSEILAQSSQLLGNHAGAVYLRDLEDEEVLRVRAARGLEQSELAVEIRIGSPMTGLAAGQARTLVCYDLQEALADEMQSASETRLEELNGYARVVQMGPRLDPDLEAAAGVGPSPRVRTLAARLRAVISTPLIARGRTFGAITLFYTEPHAFSDEEVDLARTFAQQATLAIDNARLHGEANQRMRENERRRRVAEGMRDLLAVVNSTRSLDEILDSVLGQAADLLGADAGTVLLLDGNDGEQAILSTRASRSLVSDLVPPRVPVGTAVTGVAVERVQPVVVSDLLEALPPDNETPARMEERPGYLQLLRLRNPGPQLDDTHGAARVREIARYYRAILAVPLAIRGRVTGAITLFHRRPRQFTREDVRLAEAFADQTALAMENARLHAQTTQRSRDLEALYRADEVLYSSLQVNQVLQALVDVATDVLKSDCTSVLIWDDKHERLIPGATRGFRPEVVAQMEHRIGGEGITPIVATTGQPIAVLDTLKDARVAHRITDVEGIRSILHVPIKLNDEVFGVFGVNYRQPRPLAGEEERVMLALAHRAALAIENARLFAQSEQRLQEIEALYRADETLHSSLRLDDVLRALADVAGDVLRADKTSVYVWDADQEHLVTAAAHGFSPESAATPLRPSEDLAMDLGGSMELVILPDAPNDPRLSERLREIIVRENIEAALAVPITIGGQMFGVFGVAYCHTHVPSAEEARLVQALAHRAGLAIQNARLFEQAQQAATAEERQRLARELHDAVTQTLFSASLIAEVVPKLWDRNQAEGRRRLDELRRLTRGALAEMRTLLLELRPAALIETPFGHLLRQLGEATSSRADLFVEVHTDGDEASLPAETQIALYRIAQEAFNNIAKHAAANRIVVHLRWTPDGLNLRVCDDGRGFDPRAMSPGRLGVGIMHERARGIGATLRLVSRPSKGCRVVVRWRRL